MVDVIEISVPDVETIVVEVPPVSSGVVEILQFFGPPADTTELLARISDLEARVAALEGP